MSNLQSKEAVNRRKFIKNTALVVASTTITPTVLSSCSATPEEDPVPEPLFVPDGDFGFFEGVASFDPTQDSILLWTRYTPASNEVEKPSILLEVATDIDFTQLVANESVEIDTEKDLTIMVDVRNLHANTRYFYRFKNELSKAVSIIGETKTLPATGEVTEIKFAVTSCANYEIGYFNVYGAIADSDAELVIHLGDYIYEGSVKGNNEFTVATNRRHNPESELIELEDYRNRYKQYRGDEQLQKLHQKKPFICIWDDHEFANDTYKNGAGNHQANEGDFTIRKMNAMQAWHEYIPARTLENDKIYRSFDLGGIANLMMLDTRIIGRDKQLNYNDYLSNGTLDLDSFVPEWKNPNRELLGKEQLSWLTNNIQSSNVKWQLLGSQVLMAKHLIPAELIPIIKKLQGSASISEDLALQYYKLVTELITIKSRIAEGDGSVTDAEKLRVENVLPYNLDSWDGYPVEREAVFASASGKKLLSFAGASHNAWQADLSDESGNKIGYEFATSSVTSSGLEGIFGNNPLIISGIEQANVALIDDVKYSDISRRGYILVTISETHAKADWRFVKTIHEKDANTNSGHTTSQE